jgi:mRNA interferase HigB
VGGGKSIHQNKNMLTISQRMPIILSERCWMRIISRGRLREFGKEYNLAEKPLAEWHSITSKAEWKNYDDLRRTYPSADQVRVKSGSAVTIFNIGGNKFRMIASIHYNTKTVYILSIMTHAAYSEGAWKDRF